MGGAAGVWFIAETHWLLCQPGWRGTHFAGDLIPPAGFVVGTVDGHATHATRGILCASVFGAPRMHISMWAGAACRIGFCLLYRHHMKRIGSAGGFGTSEPFNACSRIWGWGCTVGMGMPFFLLIRGTCFFERYLAMHARLHRATRCMRLALPAWQIAVFSPLLHADCVYGLAPFNA